MTRVTVTAKCQATIRRDILNHLGVRPGDRIELINEAIAEAWSEAGQRSR